MSKLTALRKFFIGETKTELAERRGAHPARPPATTQPTEKSTKSTFPLWLKIVLFIVGWIVVVRVFDWVLLWLRNSAWFD